MTTQEKKETVNNYKIESTDIILIDYEVGQGKIIVSDTWYGSYSYYWGAMGSTLLEFIQRIDSGYFVNNLAPFAEGDIDTRKTFASIRREIRENILLDWYVHMEFQKEMREVLTSLQNDITDERSFWDNISSLKHLPFYLIDDRYDRKEIETGFYDLLSNVYYHIVKSVPKEHVFLTKLHKKMKKL